MFERVSFKLDMTWYCELIPVAIDIPDTPGATYGVVPDNISNVGTLPDRAFMVKLLSFLGVSINGIPNPLY